MNSLNNALDHLKCSVVIATLSGADKLPTLLQSLARQSIPRGQYEVIVVDDGSPTEDAAAIREVCEKFSLDIAISLVVAASNGGPARARNLGIAKARGEYIFFTDDDCEVPALWLETHLRKYREMPRISFIGGWYYFARNELLSNLFAQFWYVHYRNTFFPVNLETFLGTSDEAGYQIPMQNTANLSLRRSALNVVRGFDERYVTPGGEDTDFAQRLKNLGFVGLYIPFHVRHTSELTFRRFRKVMKNRAIANYTRLYTTNWERYHTSRHVQQWFMYRKQLEAMLWQPSIRANRRALLFLGYLYYWRTGSRIALTISGWQWRRKLRKRDGN